ncbi:hypothetical protein E2C01_102249 [Portunus trituberculatus]|uniref:Uncharacterized protein n=1 Tax=Portunus trituberculatus TaxID=210409 RepID=A0A5B7KNS3_PORTR|nr:hypothetical protein [Portunus trituberculatus]
MSRASAYLVAGEVMQRRTPQVTRVLRREAVVQSWAQVVYNLLHSLPLFNVFPSVLSPLI